MMNKYIAVLDKSTKEQDEALVQEVKKYNMGWWHWIEGVWLLVCSGNNFSAADIRDLLGRTHPGVYNVVFKIGQDSTWAGFGPSSDVG